MPTRRNTMPADVDDPPADKFIRQIVPSPSGPRTLRGHDEDQDQDQHYFRCPISLEIMRDPVTLSTGQTYERAAIQRWLAAGNSTCPVTRAPLGLLLHNNNNNNNNNKNNVRGMTNDKSSCSSSSFDSSSSSSSLLGFLVLPNLTLRRLIHTWPRPTDNTAQLTDTNDPMLFTSHPSTTLSSSSSSSSSSPSPSLDLYDDLRIGSSGDYPPSSLTIAGLVSYLDHLVHILHQQQQQQQQQQHNYNNTPLNSSASNMKPNYVIMMKRGVKSLFASCLSSSDNWILAIEAKAPSVLIELLLILVIEMPAWPVPPVASDFGHDRKHGGHGHRGPSASSTTIEMAIATIELLCRRSEGREMVSSHAMVVPLMKKMMMMRKRIKVSNTNSNHQQLSRASECACGVLLSIARHSVKIQEESLEESMVPHLLLLLQQSQCNPNTNANDRGKKKAINLLKLLQTNWPHHPCITNANYNYTYSLPH